jgi:glycosyltransferase involved in cell wall biosynthesis
LTARVFLDVQWKMHSLYSELVDRPPEGYEFLSAPAGLDSAFRLAGRVRAAYALQERVLAPLLPAVLLKSYLERYLKRPPPDADLTYACEHLVFRDEDWVVGFDGVTQLVGGQPSHLRRFRRLVESRLRSPRCKAIICYYDAARRSLEAGLDCRGFGDKVHVVPFAVRKKDVPANGHRDGGRVRLLFVGSVNIPGQFAIKGGKEAIEAFLALRRRFPNLELVIRSDVPPEISAHYRDVPGLRIIDSIIPWQELERLFLSADIFLLPAHCTVAMAMIDAMSYGLPVVTTDVYANAETVEDGVTGLIVRRACGVPYERDGLPVSMFTRPFQRAIRRTDPLVVDDVVRNVSALIEDPALRRRLGEAGRRRVERGRFSIARRNARLKAIFDAATAGRNGA